MKSHTFMVGKTTFKHNVVAYSVILIFIIIQNPKNKISCPSFEKTKESLKFWNIILNGTNGGIEGIKKLGPTHLLKPNHFYEARSSVDKEDR